MEAKRIDLERLGLRSGQAETLFRGLSPEPPSVGGQRYPIEGGEVEARIDVSRTTSGYALRLLSEVLLAGPCARCLEPAELSLPIESREVDQPEGGDPELESPYVDDGVLDAEAWLHDAIALALPEKILCRRDCAGICEQCGVSLNDLEPGSHRHEKPLDPRFAKLDELRRED